MTQCCAVAITLVAVFEFQDLAGQAVGQLDDARAAIVPFGHAAHIHVGTVAGAIAEGTSASSSARAVDRGGDTEGLRHRSPQRFNLIGSTKGAFPSQCFCFPEVRTNPETLKSEKRTSFA